MASTYGTKGKSQKTASATADFDSCLLALIVNVNAVYCVINVFRLLVEMNYQRT